MCVSGYKELYVVYTLRGCKVAVECIVLVGYALTTDLVYHSCTHLHMHYLTIGSGSKERSPTSLRKNRQGQGPSYQVTNSILLFTRILLYNLLHANCATHPCMWLLGITSWISWKEVVS